LRRFLADMRAVICGAGAAGHLHAVSHLTLGVDVVGVFDPDPARARLLARMHDARIYETAEELFAASAENVSICSPPPAHVSQSELAAREGRLVFVEKPVATSAEGLERLAAMPACIPVVQWRAGRALRAVREAVARGLLGPAPTVSIDLAWNRGPHYFAHGRGSRASWGCGVLLSVGIHAVDAVCWALGRKLAHVTGHVSYREGVEVETAAVATLQFEGGALAAIRATFDAGPDATRITFTGNGLSATISGLEIDPTAGAVEWSGADMSVVRAAKRVEAECTGQSPIPLLLPFLRAAIESKGRDAPRIGDVADAHRAIFAIYDAPGARQRLTSGVDVAAE
jgi:predicted dehydrogenase